MSRYDYMNFIPKPNVPDSSGIKSALEKMTSRKTVGPAFFQRECGVTYNGALAIIAALQQSAQIGPGDKYARCEVLK